MEITHKTGEESGSFFARENGYKIRPVCPYAEKVFQRGDEYNDIKV